MYNILKDYLHIRTVNKETKLALVFKVQLAAYSIM